MRSIKILFLVFGLMVLFGFYQAIQAQTPTPKTLPADCLGDDYAFEDWLNCKIDELVTAAINQRGTNKQVQTPSIADSSTSLVDTADAPDLVGLAFNLAGLNTGSGDENKNATSLTTSAYAIYAATSQNDPLDPAFYRKYSNLRRFSFTFGRESADENNANSQKAATIAGFKVLIINNRDAVRSKNLVEADNISAALTSATGAFSNVEEEVREYLFKELGTGGSITNFSTNSLDNSAAFIALAKGLTDKQKGEIKKILENQINPFVVLSGANQKVIEKIRRKAQLSFTFQSKLRPGNGDDEYRAGLVYDFGVSGRLNFAVNGTFDYKNSKVIGGDTRGGRFAVEAYYQPFSEKKLFSGKDPLLLSLPSESKWMSGKSPTYQGQAKLTIPIFDGISIPFSVSYANRTELIKESTVQGKFGFTFDLAKALKGFKP